MEGSKMQELIVKIKQDNNTAKLTTIDIKKALESVFAISMNFEVEEISPDNIYATKNC